MVSVFDLYSIGLLIVSLAMFVIRYMREEPPVTPYLVIASTCAVGNYLGDNGGGMGALMLLIAASFLFLGCLLYPRVARKSADPEARA
ncbi:MAG TPA: hypothetical protein DDZ68_06505 [Parvularcula sp.]|nr:hypothetical protein [Parvularcula sp.]HBS33689.1 hypothetical protein [Parvularcula sp.]